MYIVYMDTLRYISAQDVLYKVSISRTHYIVQVEVRDAPIIWTPLFIVKEEDAPLMYTVCTHCVHLNQNNCWHRHKEILFQRGCHLKKLSRLTDYAAGKNLIESEIK